MFFKNKRFIVWTASFIIKPTIMSNMFHDVRGFCCTHQKSDDFDDVKDIVQSNLIMLDDVQSNEMMYDDV